MPAAQSRSRTITLSTRTVTSSPARTALRPAWLARIFSAIVRPALTLVRLTPAPASGAQQGVPARRAGAQQPEGAHPEPQRQDQHGDAVEPVQAQQRGQRILLAGAERLADDEED